MSVAGAKLPLWRKIGIGVVGTSAVVAVTLLLWRPKPKATPPAPVVRLAGQPLSLDDDPVADALDLVRRYALKELTLKLPSDGTRPLSPARLGAEIDRVRLAELVEDVRDEGSALLMFHRARLEQEAGVALDLPVPMRLDTTKAVSVLMAIKDSVDMPASDAVVNLETRSLEPEKLGFRLDVYGTLGRIEDALKRGASEVEAMGQSIEPRIMASQLGNVTFDHVLGWFETRYSRSAKYRARTYNLRQAASKLDGTVVLAGEMFDFNGTVGPRDEANGYRVAPVIAQGELVDGIGGGTCQISGTMHGAAFFAGLEIVERAPHTRPSSYIKLGLDAAVAYPTLNFRMRNNFAFPIVLHETVKKGVVRAEILGPQRTRTVTFFRRIDEAMPFDVQERETDSLPEGEKVLSQRGVPGFKATVFRIVRDGAYAVRTKRRNHYPPTTQIIKVGTGPKDTKSTAKDDGHPEYTADQYLVLTQAPNGTSDTFAESRVPGKTGRKGWQKKEGMPVFERESEETEQAD